MADRVLVVDADVPLRALVSGALQQGGYGVAVADDADEALHHLHVDPRCDLVLANAGLADEDGLRLLDRIGAGHPGLPVVILSAEEDARVAMRWFRRGAADVLLQTVLSDELLEVAARSIAQGRLLKQGAAYRESLEEMVAARTTRLDATMRELERSHDCTLEAMADALDLRDAETEGHSRRVTAYTVALAREFGLEAEELRTVARGALLHDIGKIATPDSILLKPAKLDPDEVEIMRQHCALGYEMVRKIPFLRDAAEIVYTHQETFDGTGYPRGLRGEEIPLGARIFAVADTLDAMTSDRPYRKAVSFTAAHDEVARCSGRQFDPRIVETFLNMPAAIWGDLRAGVDAAPSGVRALAS